jgi:hypothetical protein
VLVTYTSGAGDRDRDYDASDTEQVEEEEAVKESPRTHQIEGDESTVSQDAQQTPSTESSPKAKKSLRFDDSPSEEAQHPGL